MGLPVVADEDEAKEGSTEAMMVNYVVLISQGDAKLKNPHEIGDGDRRETVRASMVVRSSRNVYSAIPSASDQGFRRSDWPSALAQPLLNCGLFFAINTVL
jgi:hypothetical protein